MSNNGDTFLLTAASNAVNTTYPSYPSQESAFLVLTRYLWIVPVLAGLPGNILSILVSLQKENRKVSTCVYMIALAGADSLTLAENCWSYPVIFPADGVGASELHLQCIWYVSYCGGIMSGIVLMEMSVDRLIVVRFPMIAKTRCTTKRAVRTVIVTAALVFIANLHIFWFYKKSEKFDINGVGPSVPGQPELEALVLAYHLGFGTLIPFVVIVFCNIWIIITLREASTRRNKMVDEKTKKTQGRETRYLTRMLIIVCVAYVFTSIPFRVYDLFLMIPYLNDMYNMSEKYWQLRYLFQYWFLVHFWDWNYAINFYLYCVGGGRKYRTSVVKLFRRVK